MKMSSVVRHHWVETALAAFRVHFKECGYDVPEKVRVSVGFPKTKHNNKCLNEGNGVMLKEFFLQMATLVSLSLFVGMIALMAIVMGG